MKTPDRVNILGVGISAINMELALDLIDAWISEAESKYVCVTPVHSVMECQRDSELRHIQNTSGLTTPDGMPLVWLSRLRGHNCVDRVYGPDLMLALCNHSIIKGYRHYFYGGEEGVPDRLAANLKTRFPEIDIVGSYSPPFRKLTPEEDEKIVQMINNCDPDIVWVGLGAPKQEYWMATHLDRLTASALIGVGAAFDFHAGLKSQAPYWMQRSGLEWLFRLLSEPKRLWKRYLYDNPHFLLLLLLQMLGLKKYNLSELET